MVLMIWKRMPIVRKAFEVFTDTSNKYLQLISKWFKRQSKNMTKNVYKN